MRISDWSSDVCSSDLPVADFMRAVAATGYAGPLSLEIFNDQFRGGSPKSIAVDGRRALVNLMDQVRPAEPAIALDLPAMRDRLKVAGIEFVEFATDEQERSEERREWKAWGRTCRYRGAA